MSTWIYWKTKYRLNSGFKVKNIRNYIFFWIKRELEIMIIEQAAGTADTFNLKNERPLSLKNFIVT